MSVLKCDAVTKALRKKGFVLVRGRSKHLVYFFVHDGKKSEIATHLSHNKQEINDALQREMAEQTYLSKAEFLEMISCKIEHDELAARYAARGLLQRD
ncbi:type II toxin-antitoxin system HicA family toxin [Methanorbis furvi]|uniref:type II toxin-antitoxin system HicA family toxin n=1 Tax=Methanorbis furvi TaxID=3028299 RepID=UPI0030B8D052